MDLTARKIRLVAAAVAVGALSLTSGCLPGGGLPAEPTIGWPLIGGGLTPDPITECSSGNLMRVEADREATAALLQAQYDLLEGGNLSEEAIALTEASIGALNARLSRLDALLDRCAGGGIVPDPS